MIKKIFILFTMFAFILPSSAYQIFAEQTDENTETNIVFMENYDFSEMGMKPGQGMGTVKFPDTQNKNAWGWHGSSDPKSCIYRVENDKGYMEVINTGTTKNGTTYFWNNFPKPVESSASVSFDARFRYGRTSVYLMSDSKYDGDDTATNVPTDWPNVIMELEYQNNELSFGGNTLLDNIDPDEWCSVKVEVNIPLKTLNIYAEQNENSGQLMNVSVTSDDKSNVSILSFNPTAGSQIDITNVSMLYNTTIDADSTPSPTLPPTGEIIYNTTDPEVLEETEQLIENRPHMLRQMEDLNRGLVAVNTQNGVYLSWRLLGTEDYNCSFNVYRNGEKINSSPVQTSTNYIDKDGKETDVYNVNVITDGIEKVSSEYATPLPANYLSIPMNIPPQGVTPAGETYTYSVGDCSTGDLNGDGEYELVVKWDPSNAQDSSHDGYTGNVYIDAYTLSGEQLWRIDLGKNIRAGAHYTQFIVYDLDGNGISEIACKTGDGTIDGTGKVIGDGSADYRNSNGRIITGPEYITVFSGIDGSELYTENFSPLRNDLGDDLYKIWGDSNGNRCERYLATVAYLDGVHPSLIMVRGYYTRTVLTAYDFTDNKLTKRWYFDTSQNASKDYMGKGNHNLSVGDVDYDGFDEIIFGSALIDHNGIGIDPGLGHGDAMHFGDLDPTRPGMEVFQVHESSEGYVNVQFRDARTNQMIWGVPYRKDIGRGISADIDPNYPGEECFAADKLYSAQGDVIGSPSNLPQNFAIWWDGDLLREMADSNKIYKYDYSAKKGNVIMTADGCVSINGTKSNPALQADLFGDWREEIAFPSADSSEIRIYTTTDITEYKLFTLMHDSVYRTGISWQNIAYNQPPHTSYFIGADMEEPQAPEIYTVANNIYVDNKVTPGETSTVTATIKNIDNCVLLLAGYDDNHILTSLSSVEAVPGNSYNLNVDTDNVASIKLIAVDSLDTMKPLSKAIQW